MGKDYSPLTTNKKGEFESFQAPEESVKRENPYTSNKKRTYTTKTYTQQKFPGSKQSGTNYGRNANVLNRSPAPPSSSKYTVRQFSPGRATTVQQNPSPSGGYYTRKIEMLEEDNQILKTLTEKLQSGMMESKRNNRVLQRKLDILNDQGNDPTNVYKLKKITRDNILEERNNELRQENEAKLVEIREAQARIKELEDELHQERINKVVSPDTPEDLDQDKINKLANEIDQMDDLERKSELKLLITHLQAQKKQIKELEDQTTEKDAKIEELESGNGATEGQNAENEENAENADGAENAQPETKEQFADDYESKLIEIKSSMIDRLVTYFYNDFLDSLDESEESDRHSALIFQLKMADRRADLACIIHAHIQNYKE
jgi:hypothetical protein